MKRTAWGLSAMVGSFVLGTIIALGSLIAMEGMLDTATLAAQPLSLPTLLVACLDPLAILLEIAALVLLAMGSRQVGDLHRRLVWTAVAFLATWAVANVGGFIPLSFAGMRRGSLTLVKTGQMVKAGAALLQYAVPFLMAFGLTRGWSRTVLWLALGLSVVGNFGVIVLPISGVELERVGIPGQTIYAPRFAVDYTTGAYPALLALGYAGGALYLAVYVYLAWQTWSATDRGAATDPEAQEQHPRA